MNSRERMQRTLDFLPTDKIPHFESMFELEDEAFGLHFPDFDCWDSLGGNIRKQAIETCLDIYEKIIETYKWDALIVYYPWQDIDAVKAAVNRFGNQVFVGGMCGKGIHSIETITDWDQFSIDLFDHPERIHEQAEGMCNEAIARIRGYAEAGADFVFLPNDIAFNAGPFMSPKSMDEFIFPYLKKQVDEILSCGMYAFLHTDGQIMPIFQQLLSMEAHCLQSIDPMAGVDIKEVKKISQGKLALMGNVQCSLLQDGPSEAIRESARYCLTHASVGGGYIFSTSNTIFPGMPLENYHVMLDEYNIFNSNSSFNKSLIK